MITISFISANYVARTSNYPGGAVKNWGTFDQHTVQHASPEHVDSICKDISAGGFKAIDIWTGHANWLKHSRQHARQVREICKSHHLEITSYACGMHIDTPLDVEAQFSYMKELGTDLLAGGIWGSLANDAAPIISDVCAKLGTRYGMENHPEKTPQEMLGRIGNGKYPHLGIALDTGWCGTQAMDALDAVKRLREHLAIVHLKDVTAVGGHDTCALGDGIVAVEAVTRYLVESKWSGVIGIEHEPFDRDPMPEVVRSLQRLREWIS